jgi:hypothetical protein
MQPDRDLAPGAGSDPENKGRMKTHLLHIYNKTGIRPQAGLVKLLAEFAGTSP